MTPQEAFNKVCSKWLTSKQNVYIEAIPRNVDLAKLPARFTVEDSDSMELCDVATYDPGTRLKTVFVSYPKLSIHYSNYAVEVEAAGGKLVHTRIWAVLMRQPLLKHSLTDLRHGDIASLRLDISHEDKLLVGFNDSRILTPITPEFIEDTRYMSAHYRMLAIFHKDLKFYVPKAELPMPSANWTALEKLL